MLIVPGFVRPRSHEFSVRALRRSGNRFPFTVIGTLADRFRHARAIMGGRLRAMPADTIALVRNRRPPRVPACQAFDSQPFHSKEDGAHGYV